MNNSEILKIFISEYDCGLIKVHKIMNGKCGCKNPDCKTPGKHPIDNGWQKKALRDPDQVEAFLKRSTSYNVGLVLSGKLGVLDNDPRNNGLISMPIETIEPTFFQITGGDGHHHFFDTTGLKGLKNGEILPGVDFKTAGGFVIIDPSNHKSGKNYKLDLDSWLVGISKLPDGIYKLIAVDKKEKKHKYKVNSEETISEGKRNEALTSLIGQLRHKGLNYENAVEAAFGLNNRRCEPPLEESEIHKIAQSIYSYPELDQILKLPFTDIGHAERFKLIVNDDILFVGSKDFLRWDGMRYKKQNSEIPINEFKRLSEEITILGKTNEDKNTSDLLLKLAKNIQNVPTMKNVVKVLQSSSAVSLDEFDAHKNELNFKNGILNLDTKELLPHDKSKRHTKLIPYNYDPQAKATRFLSFEEEIHNGKSDLIRFNQKLMGYSLLGDNPEHILVIKYGHGRNGKSTETEVHNALLGEYGSTAAITTFIESKHEGIRNDLARLAGARLVVASEVALNKYLDESLIKSLTGGDKQTARFLYKENFEYSPQYVVILSVNHKPKIRGTDDGIWERIISIPFNNQYKGDKKDKHLKEKLLHELPGIMNWALGGYHLWKEEGLSPYPEIIQQSNLKYKSDENPTQDFINEKIQVYAGAKTLFSEIRAACFQWTKSQGMEALSDVNLAKLLSANGGVPCNASGGARAYKNIRLLPLKKSTGKNGYYKDTGNPIDHLREEY